VFLWKGFKAEGEVDLVTAKIGGNLECYHGQFIGKPELPPDMPALSALDANSAQVKGNVFLSDEFEAEGGVNLVGAKIDGDLECKGGQFIGYKLPALNAKGAEIKGSVSFSEGFAKGRAIFFGSRVGRAFKCSDIKSPEEAFIDLRLAKLGTLLNPEGSWPKAGKFAC
jgi:hypothetical protein